MTLGVKPYTGVDKQDIKTADETIVAIVAMQAALDARLATIDGRVDGVEALIGSTNTLLTTQNTYLDGVEAAIAATNTALATLNTAVASNAPADVTVGGLDAPGTLALFRTIGTRTYSTPSARLTVSASDNASSGLTATEVLLHASTRCFVLAGAAATSAAIPLEAGEKFHMKLTSGQQIHVIQDTAGGFLNVIPVA